MACSAVFFLDLKGKVLISRNYRGDVSRAQAERFSSILAATDPTEQKPVFSDGGVHYAYVQHNNIYLVALTQRNTNVTALLVFLERLVEIMKEYFEVLEEESIRDNFVLIYELLDEVMDYGYPQIAEVKVLKEYITQGAHRLAPHKPPQAATSIVSWRTEGIKHKKNEVFLDVVEKLNLLVAANGTVISSEILGSVKMRSFLSGMPELKLGLNDKALFDAQGRTGPKKAVEMEARAGGGIACCMLPVVHAPPLTPRPSPPFQDIKFHQCVRLARFENDRTISFIPPDGEFELMSYRLNTTVKPLIWVETVIETHGRSRVEYNVKARTQFKSRSAANNVDIYIPVPHDVDSPAFKATMGTATYVPDLDAIKWTVRQVRRGLVVVAGCAPGWGVGNAANPIPPPFPQFYGGKEALLRATFGLPSVSAEDDGDNWRKRNVKVSFEVPYYSVSGIQVRYLKITDKSGYTALPWVRYITQGGDYFLRLDQVGARSVAPPR